MKHHIFASHQIFKIIAYWREFCSVDPAQFAYSSFERADDHAEQLHE